VPNEVTILHRELYSLIEAARLLAVKPRTLGRWLEGDTRKGTFYPPVIRDRPTGSDIVTWGEFVEAGYLAEYRRKARVPLHHIRPVVDYLRGELGVPYPLATMKPYAGERELVFRLQAEGELEPALYMVVLRNDQFVLADPAEAFFRKVEFKEDVAELFRPAGPESPVIIDPRQSFGIPTVEGIRTEVIYELFEAGDPIERIASGYEIAPRAVEAAIRYEAPRPRSSEGEAA
jgi:uncharacterized protein (DUF433 family)